MSKIKSCHSRLSMLFLLQLFSVVFYTGCQDRAAQTRRHFLLLERGLQTFCDIYGRYPTTDEGLHAIIGPTPANESNYAGPFINAQELNDGWHRRIVYLSTKSNIVLRSLGSDGKLGTKDDLIHVMVPHNVMAQPVLDRKMPDDAGQK